MASEVHPGRISRPSRLRWLSRNWRYNILRDVGESREQWKSRLESRWDSIIHEMRAPGMSILKDNSELSDNTLFRVDVIEAFESEFSSIISMDAWEVFLYLTSYLLGLEYNIDHNVIWYWITEHDAGKIAHVIRINQLPITIPPNLLHSAALHHSFQVVDFLLSTVIYTSAQVEHCLDTALQKAWSPEEAINCFKLIATLCLPQMKPALSTIDCLASFMSDYLLAKEARKRAIQGRFLDYALLLMLFAIFSAVRYDFYELWQSSERLTQKGIVHHVYSTCKKAGLGVHYNDFKLRDAHTLSPEPKLRNVFGGPRILGPDDIPKNIYPRSFECQLP